jgi:hypothetical protein
MMTLRPTAWLVERNSRFYLHDLSGLNEAAIKTVNLKPDLPSVTEALQRLEREIGLARREGIAILKIVHGYGSSGVGGDIRVAVQKRLCELVEAGQIRGCVFGENWSTSDEQTWRMIQRRPELKNDRDLSRKNKGISIVIVTE